jgi:hypothetical protein
MPCQFKNSLDVYLIIPGSSHSPLAARAPFNPYRSDFCRLTNRDPRSRFRLVQIISKSFFLYHAGLIYIAGNNPGLSPSGLPNQMINNSVSAAPSLRITGRPVNHVWRICFTCQNILVHVIIKGLNSPKI